MPITDRANEYAEEVKAKLAAAGVRVETDLRNEKIGYKIREAQMQKLPYMLVVGDKEREAGTVAVARAAVWTSARCQWMSSSPKSPNR